jgi:hypothetical protein
LGPITLNNDHNRVSGEYRGILCQSCNGGLGQFNDDPSALAAYAAALDREPITPAGPPVRGPRSR